MNKYIIIGNLTRDPESRECDGTPCCVFTVAINRRVKPGAHPQADYVRVTTWRGLAETCSRNLYKGRKVAVTGPARAYGWINQNGEARARIEMNADEIEFLDSRNRQQGSESDSFEEVDDDGVFD